MLRRWITRAPVGTIRYWLTLVVVVSRLGASPLMRLKMLGLGAVMPLRDRMVGPRESHLRIRYGRLELPWVVGPRSDFDVLNELLVLEVYESGLPPAAPRTILDLGSHMGASLLFWHERFPQARIVGVEPDPTTFDRLRRNVGALAGVELRQAAVAGRAGTVRFFPAQQGWVSSVRGTGDPIVVESTTLADLIADLGQVDLLKIDIEGAEVDVVEQGPLEAIGAIVGEFHDDGDAEARERFFARLREHFELKVDEPSAFTGFSGLRRDESER
jgi:FkbM family methyltransferase